MWYFTYWLLNIIKLLCVLAGRSAVDIWWWPFGGWGVLCKVNVDSPWRQWHLNGSRLSFLKDHFTEVLCRSYCCGWSGDVRCWHVIKLLYAWYIVTVYKHVILFWIHFGSCPCISCHWAPRTELQNSDWTVGCEYVGKWGCTGIRYRICGGLGVRTVRNWMLHLRAGQTDRQTRFNGNCLCDWHTANGQTKTDNFKPFLSFLLLFLSSVVASFFNLSFLCLYLLSHCCSPAWFLFFFFRLGHFALTSSYLLVLQPTRFISFASQRWA